MTDYTTDYAEALETGRRFRLARPGPAPRLPRPEPFTSPLDARRAELEADRALVAYHEAGHLVTAYYEGWDLAGVLVTGHMSALTTGVVPADEAPTMARSLATVAAAGFMAGTLAGAPRAGAGCDSDYAKILAAAIRWCDELGLSGAEANAMASRYFAAVGSDAEDVLSAHWPAVEALAAAIHDRQRLAGAEVVGIIRAAEPDPYAERLAEQDRIAAMVAGVREREREDLARRVAEAPGPAPAAAPAPAPARASGPVQADGIGAALAGVGDALRAELDAARARAEDLARPRVKVVEHDAEGRVTAIVEDGRRSTMKRNSQGLISEIVHPDGRAQVVVRDARGVITATVVDPEKPVPPPRQAADGEPEVDEPEVDEPEVDEPEVDDLEHPMADDADHGAADEQEGSY